MNIDLDADKQFVYKISCSHCAVRGSRNWSAYRSGGDNGFRTAMDRWVFHLNEKHPGTDAPCMAFVRDGPRWPATRPTFHELDQLEPAQSLGA